MKNFHLIIHHRPDLDRFKPANGKIFDSFPTSPYDSTDPLDDIIIEPTNPKKRDSDTPKLSSSKKPKPILESPQINIIESKPKRSPPHKKVSSKPPKKKTSRASIKDKTKDQSPDPDEDEDIDDIALSDYSEPETKLRARKTTKHHRKLAKLRKAREKITKKKAITKEINSRRIVPDSDVEMEGEEEASGSNDKDSDDSDSEDSSSASTSERSGSGGSDESSDTDEENFIVNDMSTEAEKKQVKRRIDLHMPHQFRVAKQDDLSHFKVACRYLIHHILLPQVNWRTEIPEFNESCKHLDEFFHAQAVMTLETMSWTADFRRELQKRPYITSQDYRHSSKGCGACHNQSKFSKNFLRLSGKAYSPITLNPVKEKKEADDSGSDSGANNDDDDDDDDDDDGGSSDSGPPVEQDKQHKFKLELIKVTAKCTTVISGQNCAERALEYHFLNIGSSM